MTDFLRVKDNETGHEFSARRPNPAKVTVLDKPAVDADGRPLPAKHNVSATLRGKKKPATESTGTTENKETSE